jgi:hypothetical protein
MEFSKTAHALDRNLTEVTLMNIQAQYRVFLDSKELTRMFMIKPDLYRNIEMVLQAICVGCIKLSVESISESMISKYNIHSNELRCISEETAHLYIYI